jgi:hypothetical protein
MALNNPPGKEEGSYTYEVRRFFPSSEENKKDLIPLKKV